VATANGLASAQLAAAYPVSGGTYEYAHRLVHPLAGFAAGWLFLCAKTASAATAALGFAGYVLHAFGGPSGYRTPVALALVVVMTGLVAGGARRSTLVNAVIVAATLLALLAFVVATGHAVEPGQVVAQALADASPGSLLRATALVFVAYTGYGRIATLGEEVRAPATTIPRAVVATLALALAIYFAVAVTAVGAVGAPAFAAATREAAAPLEVVARMSAGTGVALAVALGAATAMTSVLLNLVLGLSRVLLAMARRGEVPAGLAEVDAHSQSPRRAVWAVGAMIAGLVMLGDLRLTWSFSAVTVLFYYGLTNLAALRLPHRSRRYPRAVTWFGLVACVSLALFVEWAVWLAAGGVLLAGFVARALVLRSSRA
jgi:APA family basic amino acid/polyamine antiporter